MQVKPVGVLALFAFICQFLFASCVYAEGRETRVLRISTGDFSPWSDKSMEHKGFVNRVIAEAFRRGGYEVKFLFWPWKRTLETARTGKVDASSFWYVSEDKVKDFIYSDPISEHKELFFYLKKNNIQDWKKLTDLSGLRIGASRSFSYTEEFWRLAKEKKIKVLEANSDELNFKKLLAGRTDVFPAAEVVGWKILGALEDNPRDKVATLENPLAIQLGHILFPKINPESEALVAVFNQGLLEMKQDGTLERYREDMYSDLN